MQTFLYVVSGLAAGIFSGGFGVGGALLATPLIRLLGTSPYIAVGTTVPAILPSTITGAWTYYKAGLVDRRAALWIAAGGTVAAFAGAKSTRLFDGHVLMLATAGLLFVLAIRLIPDPPIDPGGSAASGAQEPKRERASAPPGPPVGALLALGAISGFFSGLLGIGGGFMMVPVMIRFLRFEVKVALGTSLMVISVTVIPNIIGHTLDGNIDWRKALLLAVGVIPGARLGATLAIKAKERSLRRTLAGVLAIVAIAYAAFEVIALSS